MSKYIAPNIELQSFNCPLCGAMAHQTWHSLGASKTKDNQSPLVSVVISEGLKNKKNQGEDIPEEAIEVWKRREAGDLFLRKNRDYFNFEVNSLYFSRCYSCDEISLWLHDKLIFPEALEVEDPNADMPVEILKDYNEARAVFKYSPRSSAALLRLCIEKLCNSLDAKGSNLNNKIGDLVKRGLNAKIQKALDSVRVIGNESVHPGVINLEDNRNIARILFKLVNQIVEELITNQKEIDEIYALIPENKKEGIKQRDKK